MKKKLFTLLTLLLCLCSGAWAEEFSVSSTNYTTAGTEVGTSVKFSVSATGQTLSSATKSNVYYVYVNSNPGSISNNIPTSGNFIKVRALADGLVTIHAYCNNSSAKTLIAYEQVGNATSASQIASLEISGNSTGDFAFEVKEGNTYFCYTTGTKAILTSGYTYQPIVAKPTINPDAVFETSKDITIGCSDTEATISYSINGGESQTYSAPFAISATSTIVATASRNGYASSTVTGKYYKKSSITTTMWNLSDWVYPSGKTSEDLKTDRDFNGMTIKGTNDSYTKIEAKALEIDTYTGDDKFTQGLNLRNAASSFDGQNVQFPVLIPSKITIYFTAGGGRTVCIDDANGTFGTHKFSKTVSSSDHKVEFNYVDNDILNASLYATGGSFHIHAIIVTPSTPTLSVDPATANAFTYVVGNGPSTAQTFTVTGSNLTSTITATLSNTTNYEMKTGDGEYGAGPLENLASGTVVQVRLKSGLTKGDSYNGNLTFSSTGADNKVVALSGSVTGQTYTVTYDLNGASGDAPTQAAQEEGAVFALAAAPIRDCYTFNGWLCSVDDVPGATYNASENYTMTAGATKFTAQWTGNYASGAYTFENNATVGTTPSKTISDATYDAFQVDNLFFSGMRIQYEAGVYSGSGDDFKGWKIKTKDATIKFIVESDKTVVVGVGNLTNGAKISYTATNGTENNNVALTAKTDNTYNVKGGTMVTIKTDGASTVTLKKIFILDPATTTVTATVGKNGYTTFASPYALDLTDANRPAGLKAYKATRTNASLTFTELHQTVPAGTGLLLLGETKEGSYTIKVVASGDAVASNALIGVTSPTPKKSVADNTYYFVMKKAANADDALKFAPLTTASNVTIPAGKAYIEVPNSAFPTTTESRELSISFDEGNATGINGIEEVAPVTKTRKVVKNGRLVIETANGEYTVSGARVK